MEYTIVVRLNTRELIKVVNELISDGWLPHGSIAVDGTERNIEYLQPMVKHTVSYSGGFDPIEEPFTTTGIKDNDFDVNDVPITP